MPRSAKYTDIVAQLANELHGMGQEEEEECQKKNTAKKKKNTAMKKNTAKMKKTTIIQMMGIVYSIYSTLEEVYAEERKGVPEYESGSGIH